MENKMSEKKTEKSKAISRRDFLKDSGLVVGATAIGSLGLINACSNEEVTKTVTVTTTAAGTADAIPLSEGYLVFDHKKCTSCYSCMIACSTAHQGIANLAHARLQIIDDPFGAFPTDITMSICQQCETPRCYLECPNKDKAMCIDPETGVRYINEEECIGCRTCALACYFNPTRISFDADRVKSLKCDLCRTTPYFSETGKQACVEACPVKAIQYTTTKPLGNFGYEKNLRGEGWAKLGLPTD